MPGPRKPPRAVGESARPAPPPPETAGASQTRRTYARSVGKDLPVAKPADAPDTLPEDAIAHDDDLAAVVVKRTLKRLATGDLDPSLRDGLIAQQLLDRREEKAADRQFMLTLDQALAGGGYSPPQGLLPATSEVREDVIDGYFEEVGLAPDHLRQG